MLDVITHTPYILRHFGYTTVEVKAMMNYYINYFIQIAYSCPNTHGLTTTS